MKISIYTKGILAATLLFFMLAACSKMDDYKEEFLSGGEMQYAGKADSIKFHAGYNRAMLSWLILSDPKVIRAKVYWNFRKDSTELSINRTSGVDTVKVLIPNLTEGTQNFEIFTYDKNGNSSIPSEISGKVGGEKYEASLLHRGIDMDNSTLIPMAPPTYGLMIVWKSYNTTDGIIGMQLKYTDQNSVVQKVVIPASEVTTMLMNYVPGSNIEYKTLYQPDTLAIDTFYTSAKLLQFN